VKGLLANVPVKDAPQIHKIFRWVDGLAEGAALAIQSNDTSKAMQVQAAIMASLTTGREVPPIRLSLLRTLCHPSTVDYGTCLDKDCTNPACKGNYAELIEDEEEEDSSKVNVILLNILTD
jgi:hypothetical protein